MAPEELIGTWKLLSHQFVTIDNTDRRDNFGPDPLGTLVMTPDKRLIALITTKTRKATDPESDLLKTLLAYSGPFRIEGNQIITTVDIASAPAWLGTEQAREFQIKDGILSIMTPEMAHPDFFSGRPARGILTWEKA